MRDQPRRTPSATTAGLNTPNAAATTSGSTWPSSEPRLVKYAGPSGIATSPNVPGLGANPRLDVGGVRFRREVHLADQRLEAGGERAGLHPELGVIDRHRRQR